MTAHLTITGNATADAELRYTASGAAVATVTVAVTPRVKTDGVWSDGPSSFFRCTAWQAMAENVTESVRKGDRVTVVGELQPREYVDNQGTARTSLDVRADSIALDLRFRPAHAQAAATRTTAGPTDGPTAGPADPWATPAPTARPQAPRSPAGAFTDEPPF